MTIGIILGAGSGKRFADPIPKQFHLVGDRTLLEHTLERIASAGVLSSMIVVSSGEYRDRVEGFTRSLPISCSVVLGGAERSDSVLKGLEACPASTNLILIHDGARPNPSHRLISDLIETASQKGCGVIPGIPLEDTIKSVSESQWVDKTLDRSKMMRIQTPQVFPYRRLLEVYRKGIHEGCLGTDDATFFESYGERVYMIAGEEGNLKVTLPRDLEYFRYLLRR
jgi:2-C-methyl-D-erythritol 4-phosphate cytidylyltransferase